MEARTMAMALALLALAGCISPTMEDAGTQTSASVRVRSTFPCEGRAPTARNDVSPNLMTQESNAPGAYSYAGQAVAATGTHAVRWQNPSPTSRISWSAQSATGEMRVTIYDACGVKLYDATTGKGQEGGTRTLPAGAPGAWLVRFEFATYTGQVSASVTS